MFNKKTGKESKAEVKKEIVSEFEPKTIVIDKPKTREDELAERLSELYQVYDFMITNRINSIGNIEILIAQTKAEIEKL